MGAKKDGFLSRYMRIDKDGYVRSQIPWAREGTTKIAMAYEHYRDACRDLGIEVKHSKEEWDLIRREASLLLQVI